MANKKEVGQERNIKDAGKEKSKGHFLRSFFKIIISFLLVITLILFILDLGLFQLTSYSTLKNQITPIIEQQFSSAFSNITEQDWIDSRASLLENCSGKQEITLPLGETDASLNVPPEIILKCSDIDENSSLQDLVRLASISMFNSIYYKEYDCQFADCLVTGNEQDILVFASKKANDFFSNTLFILLGLCLVFIILMILLSKPKYTIFYNLAPVFLISGLLFITKFFLGNLGMPDIFGSIVNFFVNSLFINFLIVFILGIVFLVLAIIFKVTHKKKK
jgi:hypothetical protein